MASDGGCTMASDDPRPGNSRPDNPHSDNDNAPHPAGEGGKTEQQQPRRKLRSIIFHLLYAAEACEYEESLEAIADNFNRGFGLEIAREDEAFTIAQAVIEARDALDETYIPFLENWRFERVSDVTKLILRFSVWELLNTDTSLRIVINEAVELAKCFAEDDAYRFINGILDRVAKAHGKSVPEEENVDEAPQSKPS